MAHTYSWGNQNNLEGWNLDQPEDIAAANAALTSDTDALTKVGGSDLDPFIAQAFNELNKPDNEHMNCVLFNNCKAEANNLLNKAKMDQAQALKDCATPND